MDAGVQQGVRRSATLPTQFQARATSNGAGAESASQDPSETIFHHPHAKIIQFSVDTVLPKSRQSSTRWYSPEIADTLPWKASSERVVAAGPLLLYALTQSPVAFFQSGKCLLTLRPRSQCWCVDGESRFAIIIMDEIYRIELPFSTEEDKANVESLKIALSRVLRYEKTACPFRRGFTVDLPDEPESVIPKGPAWSHINLRKTRASEPAHSLRIDEGKDSDGRVESSGQSEEDDVNGSGNRMQRDSSPIASDEVKPAIPKRSSNRSVTTPVRQRVADFNASATSTLQPSPSSPRFAKETLDLTSQEKRNSLESANHVVDEAVSHSNTIAEGVPANESQIEGMDSIRSDVSEDGTNLPNTAVPTKPSLADQLPDILQPVDHVDETSLSGPSKLAHGASQHIPEPEAQAHFLAKLTQDNNTETETTSTPQVQEQMADAMPTNAEVEAAAEDSIPNITIEDDQPPLVVPDAESRIEQSSLEHSVRSEPEMSIRAEDFVTAPAQSITKPMLSSTEANTSDANIDAPSSSTLVPPPKSEGRLTSRRSFGRLSPGLPPTNPPGLVSRSLAVLLGPPSGLVQVMLEIARRIAHSSRFAGLYRFKLGPGDGSNDEMIGRWYKLPGAWISDDDDIDRALGEDHDITHESNPLTVLDRESEDESWSEHSDFDTAPTTSSAREAASATQRKMRAASLDD